MRDIYLSSSIYQFDTSLNSIHVNQTWKLIGRKHQLYCWVQLLLAFKKNKTFTYQ